MLIPTSGFEPTVHRTVGVSKKRGQFVGSVSPEIPRMVSVSRTKKQPVNRVAGISFDKTSDYLSLHRRNEKIAYWASYIRLSMRMQGEAGLDEYAAFNLAWLKRVLAEEPKFLEWLTIILSQLTGQINKKEFRKRIKQDIQSDKKLKQTVAEVKKKIHTLPLLELHIKR